MSERTARALDWVALDWVALDWVALASILAAICLGISQSST
ncbi:hypothetical protein [Streptomyces parvus]